MMRILILGGGGTLGHKLWQTLPSKFPDTFVSIRKTKDFYAKCGLFTGANVIDNLDLRDFAGLNRVLDEIKPSVIVNCAGITPRREDAHNDVNIITINSLLPHKLAAWCAANHARLIHFSTDCVFNGEKGNYNELSLSDANDLYGRTKALGEVISPYAFVLRTSMIGREIFGGTELLEWFLAQRGKKIKGYRKAVFSGLTTNQHAAVVGDVIGKSPALNGCYNVASQAVSKYDLLLMLREAYNLDVEIEPDDSVDCRRNLDGSKFVNATGFVCPSWRQMLAEMAADKTPYSAWRK
jgi:dTDP-4-dehydrorhamnose reductase